MGEISKIAWTDATFNPWIGCTRVSAGCDNCYAETQDHRWGHDRWGVGKARELTSEGYWTKPLSWNRKAELTGRRVRVFCASLADVFDSEVDDAWRERLWALVERTPHLDWLLLTKRTPLIAKKLPPAWLDKPRANVWLGTTVESQDVALLRVTGLLDVPAAVRWLSVEPQIGPVNLRSIVMVQGDGKNMPHVELDALKGLIRGVDDQVPRIDWVISGGESGAGARPFNLAWARSLAQQCAATGTAFFMKQLGAVPVMDEAAWRAESLTRMLDYSKRNRTPDSLVPLKLLSSKGDDPAEWPDDLRIRQFPEVRS